MRTRYDQYDNHLTVSVIPERQRGFVVLPGTRFPPRVTHSVSDAERDRTGTKKAKDWDGLEQIGKRHPVGTPKVHVWKLGQGAGAIYVEDRLMLLVAVEACLGRSLVQ